MKKLKGCIVRLLRDCIATEISPEAGTKHKLYKGMHMRVFTQIGDVAEAYIIGDPTIYHVSVDCLQEITKEAS